MSEFAPDAIRHVFDRLAEFEPGMELELGGILGDAAHTYGYHRARAALPGDDYSVQLRRDQLGPRWAASALDITPASPREVITLTTRLMQATNSGDRRLRRVVREFYGTLDGRKVFGFDVHDGVPRSADDSHLWHLHISFYRKHACQRAVLAPLADVLAGR